MLSALVVISAAFAPAFAFPHLGFSEAVDAGQLFKRVSSGCSTSGIQSCRNTSAVADTCCFEVNGQLVQPQFWDVSPQTGPDDSWTIHGLWPDYCTTGYPSTCDPSRAYTDIAGLLTAQGASDTLAYMQDYWQDISGTSESFWEHEWSKHGTCYSTLRPSCLPSGSPKGAEAVAYFQTVVGLFKTLPTYTWLAEAGIVPSSSATYTLAQITSAIKAKWGYTVALDCSSGNINQIYYYFNLKGSVIDGSFVPINAPSAGSCPSTGLKYPVKTGGSTPTTTQTSTTTKTTAPGATGLPSKAYIKAITSSGSTVGGLLSAGTWSTQTLATMTISGTPGGFTMFSSKGNCGVSSGKLTCGSGVTSSTFTAVTSGGSLLLSYSGSTAFTSDGTPSGTTVYPVYTGSSHSQGYSLAIVST